MRQPRRCAAAGGSGTSNVLYHFMHQLKPIRLPTILWQFVWNYVFGPCLLWKIRLIRDIYSWRMQTTMAIVAG